MGGTPQTSSVSQFGRNRIMRILRLLQSLPLFICLSLPGLAQSSPFIGTWETHKSSPTARAAITVTIVQNGEALIGTVYLAHLDSGSERLEFNKSSRDADVLCFTTPVDEEGFYWKLTLGKGAKTGVLKGSYHEMLIDEKVKKR